MTETLEKINNKLYKVLDERLEHKKCFIQKKRIEDNIVKLQAMLDKINEDMNTLETNFPELTSIIYSQ